MAWLALVVITANIGPIVYHATAAFNFLILTELGSYKCAYLAWGGVALAWPAIEVYLQEMYSSPSTCPFGDVCWESV